MVRAIFLDWIRETYDRTADMIAVRRKHDQLDVGEGRIGREGRMQGKGKRSCAKCPPEEGVGSNPVVDRRPLVADSLLVVGILYLLHRTAVAAA